MDMTGTTYAPAKLWALTVDGRPNRVTDEAFKAAQRSGIRTIIAPARNEAETDDIPEHLRRRMAFVWVSEIGEVFDAAFGG